MYFTSSEGNCWLQRCVLPLLKAIHGSSDVCIGCTLRPVCILPLLKATYGQFMVRPMCALGAHFDLVYFTSFEGNSWHERCVQEVHTSTRRQFMVRAMCALGAHFHPVCILPLFKAIGGSSDVCIGCTLRPACILPLLKAIPVCIVPLSKAMFCLERCVHEVHTSTRRQFMVRAMCALSHAALAAFSERQPPSQNMCHEKACGSSSSPRKMSETKYPPPGPCFYLLKSRTPDLGISVSQQHTLQSLRTMRARNPQLSKDNQDTNSRTHLPTLTHPLTHPHTQGMNSRTHTPTYAWKEHVHRAQQNIRTSHAQTVSNATN